MRNASTSPASSSDARDLRRIAEDRDWDLAALTFRGPVQSRPEFELDVAAAEAASFSAWRNYADALFA